MFEIEYSLTLEDEINSLDTGREYISKLPVLSWDNNYSNSIVMLIITIPYIHKCLTTSVPLYTGFAEISIFNTILNLLFVVLLMPQIMARLPMQNFISKYRVKRSWLNNPELTKPRKLTINKTEFIFNKTETYKFPSEEKIINYKWQELRRYLESDLGFFLHFVWWNKFTRNTDSIFIPKRIFTTQEQIDTFRKLLSQCEQ